MARKDKNRKLGTKIIISFVLLICFYAYLKPNAQLYFDFIYSRLAFIINKPVEKTNNFINTISSALKTGKEIEKLRQEILNLRIENHGLRYVFNENKTLKHQLNFSKHDLKILTTEVLSATQNNFDNSIFIKTTLNNMEFSIGAPAISQGSLVGRIFSISDNTARIALVTNPDSRIAGFFEKTGEKAIIIGLGHGQLEAIFTQNIEKISEGELFYSLKTEQIPSNIPIAKVEKISQGKIFLRPLFDQKQIRIISVISTKN